MVQGRSLWLHAAWFQYLLAATLGDLNSLSLSVPICDMSDDTHS